jgi:hypothetical protein
MSVEKCVTSRKTVHRAITVVLELSFRDAVNTSLYALTKTSLFSTALKDSPNTTVVPGVIENLKK